MCCIKTYFGFAQNCSLQVEKCSNNIYFIFLHCWAKQFIFLRVWSAGPCQPLDTTNFINLQLRIWDDTANTPDTPDQWWSNTSDFPIFLIGFTFTWSIIISNKELKSEDLIYQLCRSLSKVLHFWFPIQFHKIFILLLWIWSEINQF